MADLTGHEAGNGGYSQGKPVAAFDLLYSALAVWDIRRSWPLLPLKAPIFDGSIGRIAGRTWRDRVSRLAASSNTTPDQRASQWDRSSTIICGARWNTVGGWILQQGQ